MGTESYDRVFILGTVQEGNRELIHVPANEDTDLPAGAEFLYTDAVSRFPYLAP